MQVGAASDEESGIIPFPDFVDSSVSTGGMDENKMIQHDEVPRSAVDNGTSASLPSAPETVAKGHLNDHKVHLTPTMTDSDSVPFILANSPTIVVTASTDTDKSVESDESIKGTGSAQEEHTEDHGEDGQEESDDDREHRTHFKSWGTPVIRNKQSKYTPSRNRQPPNVF
jgi:hypothetical protein